VVCSFFCFFVFLFLIFVLIYVFVRLSACPSATPSCTSIRPPVRPVHTRRHPSTPVHGRRVHVGEIEGGRSSCCAPLLLQNTAHVPATTDTRMPRSVGHSHTGCASDGWVAPYMAALFRGLRTHENTPYRIAASAGRYRYSACLLTQRCPVHACALARRVCAPRAGMQWAMGGGVPPRCTGAEGGVRPCSSVSSTADAASGLAAGGACARPARRTMHGAAFGRAGGTTACSVPAYMVS